MREMSKCERCGVELEEAVKDGGAGEPWVQCWLEPTNDDHTDARCAERLMQQRDEARATWRKWEKLHDHRTEQYNDVSSQLAAAREALDRVKGMCDVPDDRCMCGRPRGIHAVKHCAEKALAALDAGKGGGK